MAVTAKPLSLAVRPLQVANLCFEVGGILGESFTELGANVSAFDFDSVYKSFRDAGSPEGNLGRLEFDSVRIDKLTKTPLPPPKIKEQPNPQSPPIILLPGPEAPPSPPRPFALAALRGETVKAALNKAIIARENAFITKYGGVAAIADVMRKIIPFRGQQINNLSFLSNQIKNILNAAYENDAQRNGVVMATINSSILDSKTTEPDGKSISTLHATENLTTKNIEFRAPILENLARDDRAQIDIGREVINFVGETHFLDRLEDVFKNELASIDSDVNQMQVAYLNTILMSPINGIVTGVYKNPGDPVAPGEPVFRVENNTVVLIVAKLVCRGPVSIGSLLEVQTTLFDRPGSVGNFINAEIVAARGEGDADQWEVIGKVSNLDAAGNSIFPLGYSFDYDNTKVFIGESSEISSDI